jgi:hypothetical protein
MEPARLSWECAETGSTGLSRTCAFAQHKCTTERGLVQPNGLKLLKQGAASQRSGAWVFVLPEGKHL